MRNALGCISERVRNNNILNCVLIEVLPESFQRHGDLLRGVPSVLVIREAGFRDEGPGAERPC